MIIISYIYKITNNINDKVYIGNTSKSIKKRWAEHLRALRKEKCKNRPLYYAMNQYGAENFEIELIEECSKDISPDRERYWISYYNSYENGYNATYGGLGSNIIDYDEVVRVYSKVGNQKETAQVLNISPETVSDILKLKNIDCYTSHEVLAKVCSKPIDMFSLDNKFIKRFPSIINACKYIIEKDSKPQNHINGIEAHIIDVCKGRRSTAYNYKWKYADNKSA